MSQSFTDRDLVKLQQWLCPRRADGDPRELNELLVEILWAGGACHPVDLLGIDKALDREEARTARVNRDNDTDSKAIGRVKTAIKRLNKKLWTRDCPLHGRLYIRVYRPPEDEWKAVLIAEPKEALRRREEAEAKSDIRVNFKDIEGGIIPQGCIESGIPILVDGDQIAARLCSPITGYLSVFHVDAHHLPTKLFPKQREKFSITAQREGIEIPKALRSRSTWTVEVPKRGKKRGLEYLVAVVTREDVLVKETDIAVLDLKLQIRMRGVAIKDSLLNAQSPGSIARGAFCYEYRSR